MRNFFLSTMLALSFSINATELIVHEWGTFTSFMGSDGVRLSGMHHEEEHLPGFVYGFHQPQESTSRARYGTYPPRCGKIPCEYLEKLGAANEAIDVLPKNPIGTGITQKMETPVIYFYGKEGQRVKVDIDFPKGIISQYYPKALSYSPKYDAVSTLGPSKFSFDVKLLAKNFVGNMPKTTATSVWNPSRQVNANTIESGGEHEKFIFYRGVGDFDAKVVVKNRNGSLHIKNNSAAAINSAFVLNSDGKSGVIVPIGTIGAKEKVVSIPDDSLRVSFASYLKAAKSMIEKALIKDGLFVDEAKALVNTWEHSYFSTPGIRVLYLLPRIETDAIIPLKLAPAPKSLVRSMVGRIEVMTTEEEETGLTLIANTNKLNAKRVFGTFYEPKLRRLLALAKQRKDHESAAKIENLLP